MEIIYVGIFSKYFGLHFGTGTVQGAAGCGRPIFSCKGYLIWTILKSIGKFRRRTKAKIWGNRGHCVIPQAWPRGICLSTRKYRA